jgi:hypothetical protein
VAVFTDIPVLVQPRLGSVAVFTDIPVLILPGVGSVAVFTDIPVLVQPRLGFVIIKWLNKWRYYFIANILCTM